MRKAEHAKEIAKILKVQQVTCRNVIDLFLHSIREELIAGRTVELRNFGVFKPVWRKPKSAQALFQGKGCDPITIPARWTVVFRPSKLLKRRMKYESISGPNQDW